MSIKASKTEVIHEPIYSHNKNYVVKLITRNQYYFNLEKYKNSGQSGLKCVEYLYKV